MRKRSLTVGALALAALGVCLSAAAQGPGRRGPGPGGPDEGPGFGPRIDRMAERLGLSEEQKEQLEALRAKQRETLRPLFEAMRGAHEAFENALEADSPDAAKVGTAALAMKAARDKAEAAQKHAFDETKALLTPEQVEKLEAGRERVPGPGYGPRRRRVEGSGQEGQ